MAWISNQPSSADVHRIPVAREVVEDQGRFAGAEMAGERLAAEAELERVREQLTELGRQIRLLRCNSRWRSMVARSVSRLVDELPRSFAHRAFNRIEPIVEKLGAVSPSHCGGCVFVILLLMARVSDPALQRRMIRG